MNDAPCNPATPTAAGGLAGRVLVVDDNSVLRVVLSGLVTQLGHGVATAANGREALELLRTQPFDLVLLDLEMPELSGHDVLERMKADAALAAVPVIVISGVEESAQAIRCISAGAEDYLPKPFNPVLLNARIGACLEKKRLRDAERRKTAALEQALADLRTTQARLLVQEKMASLGALTAGIAHEIKNPLNFVTNFAQLAGELAGELRAEVDRLGGPRPAETAELLATLEQNIAKIREHGRRADAIVAGMLLHARGGAGAWQNVDFNALVQGSVNLAYHGMRAHDASCSIVIEADYDPRPARPA